MINYSTFKTDTMIPELKSAKILDKQQRQAAFIVLMAIRCNFISNGKKKILTKKGSKRLPPWCWRFYNKWLCVKNKDYRNEMIHFLRQVEGNGILENL